MEDAKEGEIEENENMCLICLDDIKQVRKK
jgi:hypothetical protein